MKSIAYTPPRQFVNFGSIYEIISCGEVPEESHNDVLYDGSQVFYEVDEEIRKLLATKQPSFIITPHGSRLSCVLERSDSTE